MAMYDQRDHEVHVLLVDRDSVTLVEATKLLQANSYRVTAIQDAPIALSMLSKGKTTFDLLMVDVSSSNLQGYELLYEAANMEVTVILMSGDDNHILAKCAIEDGAYLFIQKPATPDFLRYLWQYTYREKLTKHKEECLRREQINTANKITCEVAGTSLRQDIGKEDISTKKNRKRRGQGIVIKDTDRSITKDDSYYNNRTKRSRMCTSWTLALHQRFVVAIKELGEGRCYPREIVRLMNVPGLTTVQVSSHLQRCRLGWRHPEERDAPPLDIPKPYTSKMKAHGLLSNIEGTSQPFIPTENFENVAYDNNVLNDSTPTPAFLNMGQDALALEPVGFNFLNMNDSTHMPGLLDMGPDGAVPKHNNQLEVNFPDIMAGADADQWLSFPEFSPDFLNEVFTDNSNVQDLHVNQVLPEKAKSTENEESDEDWGTWIASLLNDD